ncbi:MAG TPA: hypothetical protein VED22_01885 [Nitrososphaerales archaeon]|nr:hypothetical protein [Nitrososphaerales archaeon]
MENVSGTTHGKWAGRFIWAAVVEGLIAVVATILIVEPWSALGINSYYSPSKVIAGNGAGTWMFTGYIAFLVVGVVATAVTAVFYFYIEDIQGRVYKGFSNLLAWGHLLFMNVGVAGSMIIMMYQGYLAGVAAAPVSEGGLGYSAGQIHVNILSWTVNPIGGFILLACLGAVLGGLGYFLRSASKK